MSSRPYAAILVCGKIVKIEDVMAPLQSSEARAAVEPRYPGYTLVALIPGIHAGQSFSYGLDDGKINSTPGVDPFDMTYLNFRKV